MLAYKVLSGGRSTFTGWRWPLPEGDEPGDWVDADKPLGLCTGGIHACTPNQLPPWLGTELWEIELDGEILRTDPALIAARGRLGRRVEAWDEDAQAEFAQACVERARRIAVEYPAGAELVAHVECCAGWGGAAAAGYFTAVLAGERATGRRSGPQYDAAFGDERAEQAGWLRRELSLGH